MHAKRAPEGQRGAGAEAGRLAGAYRGLLRKFARVEVTHERSAATRTPRRNRTDEEALMRSAHGSSHRVKLESERDRLGNTVSLKLGTDGAEILRIQERRRTVSDIAALMEEESAAREEEARLDAELDATHREIASIRLSLANISRISLATSAWAARARQRAATLGILPAERVSPLLQPYNPDVEPEPEPEPVPDSESETVHSPVHIVPTDTIDNELADRPDWALSSERSAPRDLVKERFDLSKDVVEQGQVKAVYENQRRSLLGDFSANNLLPGTRGPWSDINGVAADRGRLPHGWHWAVEHRQGHTDPDGWEYAFHFRASWFSQPEREGSFGGAAWVRRRKWVATQSSRAAVHLKLATPAADIGAGLQPAPSYRCALRFMSACSTSRCVDNHSPTCLFAALSCILEVWEARSLGSVARGNPDRDTAHSKPPAAVFRIRVGDHCHESAARPPSNNPQWGDETNSWQCRRAFRIATPTDILAEVEEDDDIARLARSFSGIHGVKVRDRVDLPSLTTYQKSFTGKKAVDWLTGVHSRGYHGSGLVATRNEAISIAQKMMDREIFDIATQDVTARKPSNRIFNDSNRAFYRFNAEWLAAKSRRSKIMLRKKSLDGHLESVKRSHATAFLDHTIAECDEVVVELLDAQLAARLGRNDDILPEQLLGSVAIPLRTILQHEASEGWHNLTGPGVQSGEVRIGWLVVQDTEHVDSTDASQCPSPKHHLKVRAREEAVVGTAAKEVRQMSNKIISTGSLRGTTVQSNLLGEEPFTPGSSAAQASACCRMAQGYIDIGDLGSAQTCISAGLGLIGSSDNGQLLEMQEQLTKCCSIAISTQIDRSWSSLLQRKASGGSYSFSQSNQYDRKAPWITWHGTRHANGGFCDEDGFVVLPEFAHVWSVAHSYSLCIAARHLPEWETLIPASVTSSNRHDNRGAADPDGEMSWTGWLPGTSNADAVSNLVMQHGVPPELRQLVWPVLLGATKRQRQALDSGHEKLYSSLVKRYMNEGDHRDQIRKDIPRTLPGQCTVVNTPEGSQCLERVVGALSVYDCWYGYTQSLNMVAAHLLVVMSLEAEEQVFWMLAQIVEVVVPEYYSAELYGMNADAVVLSMLAEHWVGTARTRLADAGVPMSLVASRWLLPLCAEILPPCTLYRLWDVLFLTRSATPLHAAALTIMRGAHADSFWDFEGAMHVLTKGASSAYDAQPFLEHVTTYMSLFSERDMAEQHYRCLVSGYIDADGIPIIISPLEHLIERLPDFDRALRAAQTSSGYNWDKTDTNLDRWQIFRLAVPFAHQLECEAEFSQDDGICDVLAVKDDGSSGHALSISVAGACNALGTLLPGLRQNPGLLKLFVQRVLVTEARLPGEHDHGHEIDSRVTLACWLNTVIALQREANDSPARRSLWWRFCGGGGTGGRIRDGAKGAMMHDVVATICAVYEALGTSADNRARFPTDKAVEASVAKFYTERDKSWVKRSAKQHGLGRHSTAQLISTQHKMAFEALTWDSGLCLGVPIPSRRPQPSKSAWLLSV